MAVDRRSLLSMNHHHHHNHQKFMIEDERVKEARIIPTRIYRISPNRQKYHNHMSDDGLMVDDLTGEQAATATPAK